MVARDITNDGDPDEVWEALNDPELLAEWLGDDGQALVEEAEPSERLVLWLLEDDEPGSRLELRLIAVPDGTRVTVTEAPVGPFAPGTSRESVQKENRAMSLKQSGRTRTRRLVPSRLVVALLALVVTLGGFTVGTPATAGPGGTDVVRVWNAHALAALSNPGTAPTPGAGQPATVSALHMAMVQLAV